MKEAPLTKTPSAAADKTAHTLGPWTVAEYGIAEEKAKYLCVKKGGKTICRIDPQGNSLSTNSQDEANARLIAAAPNLLEALKAFMHDCDCYDGMNIEQFNSWKSAKAAIAKATGNA